MLKIEQDGRVVLTDSIKACTGIGDRATFVGQGFKFQIWEPQRFAERQREARSHLLSVTRGLGKSSPTKKSNPGNGDPA